MTHPHTLVVLDPSSDWGEVALDYVIGAANVGENAITLFAALDGPAAFALSEYAADTGVSIAEAGDVYVEQVSERIVSRGAVVSGHATGDGDLAAAIVDAAVAAGATAVAIPAGGRIVDERTLERLLSAVGIRLVVVPAGRKTAA